MELQALSLPLSHLTILMKGKTIVPLGVSTSLCMFPFRSNNQIIANMPQVHKDFLAPPRNSNKTSIVGVQTQSSLNILKGCLQSCQAIARESFFPFFFIAYTYTPIALYMRTYHICNMVCVTQEHRFKPSR